VSNPNDKVYTPASVVDEVLEIFLPLLGGGTVLEPFRGAGAFYDKLPKSQRSWCEIDQGRDFMDHHDRYDWIITNPPYSSFHSLLKKMLQTADNLVLVIPPNKLLSSMPRLMDVRSAGSNIHRIHYLGSGRQLKFPFGFPVAAIHLRRGYVGDVEITYADRCRDSKAKRSSTRCTV
jgi:hypothetical protein